VRNHDLLESRVSDVMEASFPTVDVDAGSDEVTRRLRTNAAVLVEEYGRIVGIITRHDVLDMTAKG
jgi:predicted transcriptional regulator